MKRIILEIIDWTIVIITLLVSVLIIAIVIPINYALKRWEER